LSDEEMESREGPDDDQLSALRIKQIATLRRAAYRSRSHAVVACAACAVVAVQLVWNTISDLRGGAFSIKSAGYGLFALAGIYGAVHFFGRARAYHRMARQTALHEPAEPPDLSSLSDGSQRWKNLEQVEDDQK